MSKLSVVVPAYNEHEAIVQVVQRILAVRHALQREAGIAELEVLVVDDGSTDGTARALMEAARLYRWDGRVRLIRHQANQGYGAALRNGLDKATGDLLAFLDGDGTYPPGQLPALCLAARRPGTALVLGDRLNSPSSQMPTVRRAGNALFARLAGLLARTPAVDCCSGMRVLPVATWKQLRPLPDGLDFTPAMTMRALHRQLTVRQVTIPYHERIGRSKLKVVRDGLRFLGTILRETWVEKPARLWALAAPATAALLGLLAATAVLGVVHRPHWARLGLSLLLAAALLVAGFWLAGADALQARRGAQGEEEQLTR